jgi:hypothetical protein
MVPHQTFTLACKSSLAATTAHGEGNNFLERVLQLYRCSGFRFIYLFKDMSSKLI